VKISQLELFKVPPRWLFLKMTTSDGLVGWGEPVVEGKADTVAAAVHELSGYVEGRNPDQRISGRSYIAVAFTEEDRS
jgi:galactonate dehydratase